MSRKRNAKPNRNYEAKQPKRRNSQTTRAPIRRGILQPIIPKTRGQEDLIDAIHSHEITICDGPSGSGKTLIAFGSALHFRESDHKIKRIIIVRPMLPAGDDDQLGFLPGSLEDKMSPFLMPLVKDAAPLLIESEENLNRDEHKAFIEDYLGRMDIEVVPFQYMRGRSFNNCFIILDEAQNCTKDDFKLFLTRVGKNCKVVIEGDSGQSDRDDSWFIELQNKLEGLDGIKIVALGIADIVRNPMISKILMRLDS